jgi:starch synthase
VPFEAGGDDYGSPVDPARYADDLARAVNGLVEDPERAAAFGRRGRERVLAEFSWSGIAKRTVGLYRSLLA